MKRGEAGYLLMELAVAVAIIGLIAGAAATTTYRTIRDTQRTNEHMTAVRNVDNAGYWINRDAQMADIVITTNLTAPQFLVLKWTDWGYDQDSVYYSATYSIDNVVNGVGTLKRLYQSSQGGSQQMLVAEYIYYNPGDPGNTTQVSHDDSLIDLKLVTSFGQTRASREYKIYCRPNFMD